jgi:hypothetical protein
MIPPSGGKKRIAPSHNSFFPMNGRKALVTLFLLLLIPVYWIELNTPAVGYYHDDGIYVVTAKALAEGKGYRIISLPGDIVQTKYPVLFPALLAIVWKIFPHFPGNAIFLKMVPLIGTFFWVWLLHWFFKEKDRNASSSTGIILITLASPWVIFFSVTILSETIFAFLCTGALIYLNRLEGNPGGEEIYTLFLSSILAAAAFLTRTAGLPLLFAGTTSLLLRRRYRTCVRFFLLYATFVSPWILWQAIHHGSYSWANLYYTSSNYQNWNILVNYPPLIKAEILAKNILFLLFAPTNLLGLNIRWFGTSYFPFTLAILVTSFSLLGFYQDLRMGIKSIHLFLLFYYGMLLIWVWPPIRFVVPIFPFWLFFAYKGIMLVCANFSSSERIPRIVNEGLVILLCLCLGSALYLSSSKVLRIHQATVPISNSPKNENYDWFGVSSLLAWTSENTPRDSVLLGNLDPTIYLYTGRKAVRGFVADPYLLYYSDKSNDSLGSESDLLGVLITQKVDYIIRTPDENFKEVPIFNRMLDSMLLKNERIFHLVKEGSQPGFKIYWVNQQELQKYPHGGNMHVLPK